jgi:phosphocarrier protein
MADVQESSNMVERDIAITNKLGLHARASAKLVQLLQGFKSNAWLIHRGREINAKSIMGVMMLAAGVGQTITLRTDGPDEAAALDAMVDLFARKFDEGA